MPKIIQSLLLVIFIFGLAATSFYGFGLKDRLQYFSFDTFNKLNPRQSAEAVMIVDIDEESLRELGQWPWSRDVMADLVFKLKSYGVKATVFDMVFAEYDRTSPHLLAEQLNVPADALKNNDQMFANAIKDANNVVTGFIVAGDKQTRRIPYTAQPIRIKRNDKIDVLNDVFSLRGVATNLPELSKFAKGNGIFLATPSNDGIIREIPLLVEFKDTLYPTLGLEALRVAHDGREFLKVRKAENPNSNAHYEIYIGQSGIVIPVQKDGKMRIRFRELNRDTDYVSAHKILDDRYSQEIREKLFQKIVFVGTSAEGLKDIRSTPLNVFIPGVELHVNLVEQILQNDFVFRNDYIAKNIEALAILIIGILVFIISRFAGVFLSTVITTVLIFSMMAVASTAYSDYGLLFDPLYPSVCIILIFIITTILNYIRSESQAKEVKEAFGMYLSPDVLQEVTNNPDTLKLGGEMRELSVLFTDIRNFTTISENLTPEELINTMNDFLTPMSDVVMKTRGTIDKYMGDAMMAFWNAPLDDDNHARHAVKAAIEMRHVLDPINKELESKARKEGRTPLVLAAGMGVNTGLCSVGNMGSKQRFAYSALGDAVNLASRLEGQTKSYGLDLLIGEDTAKQVRDFAIVEIDKIQVKGKTKPVRIYTVLGDESLGKKTSFRKFKIAHGLFVRDYRRSNFDLASARLQELMIDKYGQMLQPYYNIMIERMIEFQKTPPQKGWGGVFVAETK